MTTSIPRSDHLLSIVAPAGFEEALLDALLAGPSPVAGVTVLPVHGHGAELPLASVVERIRGRAEMVELRMVIARSDACALIDRLRLAWPEPAISWWLIPIADGGRFA